MASDESTTVSDLIKIFIKLPTSKETLEVNPKATIKEVKDKLCDQFSFKFEQVCLIFAGRILKDHETLDQHNIKEGLTIHLLIRSKKPETSSSSSSSSTTTTSNTNADTSSSNTGNSSSTSSTGNTSNPNLGFLNGLGGFPDLPLGGGNLSDFQQSVMRDFASNPDLARQLLDHPLIHNLFSDRDYLRSIITSNPQIQELLERNPEINHMFNNPEILRQTMEMMRNPAAFQELMRTQDRALSNLESLPGGYNALRRMYTELQEPMMNAAQDQLVGENPFASFLNQNNRRSTGSGSENDASSNQQNRTENRDPIPNPWSRNSNTSTAGRSGNSATSGASNASGTFNASNPFSGFLNNSNMQDLMSQMMGNQELMSSMLNGPMMEQMMQMVSSNPELLRQTMANNPMFGGNSELVEQMMNVNPNLQRQLRENMPDIMRMMQSPELRSSLSNPETLSAIEQIFRGMQSLQRTAPDLLSVFGATGAAPSASTNNSSTATSSTSTTTSQTTPGSASQTPTSGGDSSTASNGSTGNNSNSPNVAQISQLMAQLLNSNSNSSQPPEERYRSQLEQLNAMGFTDRQSNINALVATMGDVNAAVERLLRTHSYFS